LLKTADAMVSAVSFSRGETALFYSRIAGTGSYLPERTSSPTPIWRSSSRPPTSGSASAPASASATSRRSGETTGDLAFQAAKRALDAAGVEPGEIDLIVLGTTTPDIIFPSTACLLQHRLGANGCAAFDVNAACSGFIYALACRQQVHSVPASARRRWWSGAETLTRMLDWSDPAPACCSATAPGAVVLKASDEPASVHHLHADGGYKELLFNPVGVSAGFRRTSPTTACA
jgi:3-oxoacyl-[acyl-carrier-protein] synthase-3